MLQRMSAEIIFLNTDGPGPVIQKLLEIDYDFEVLKWDWHDGTKPDTTVTVRRSRNSMRLPSSIMCRPSSGRLVAT